MLKRMALLSLAAALCLGASCTIRISPGGNDGNGGGGSGDRVYLDETDANIIIAQEVGAATASVTATIQDSLGRTVTLASDQAVEINGEALSGPGAAGEFTATVAAANQYEITVVEPTRGIDESVIDAPAAFQITSPIEGGKVSLSGFTLKWSGANTRLQVRITLSQTYQTTVTRSFGPFTDTGSRELTAADLAPFRHGGDLTMSITVTKINTTNNVDGFDSGTAAVHLSALRVAKPGP